MTPFLTPRFTLLALGGAAALLVTAFAGCDQSNDSESSLRSQAHGPHATGSQYDVGLTGYGGLPSAERSSNDPLRYAYYGFPQYAALLPQPLILFNDGYVVGYDTKRQLPLWVCYRLNDLDHSASASKAEREHATTEVDPRLGPHQQMPDPKQREGIVGLPLAPAGALLASYGVHASAECDYTSNVLPCAAPPGWQQLQSMETTYARSNHELWVITGPVLKDDTSSDITGVWKIQIVVQMGKTVTQAVVLPLATGTEREHNRDALIDLSNAITTIEAIGALTHLSLLPQLHNIDGQSVAEVLSLPAPTVWPLAATVASSSAPTTGRR